MKDLFLSLQLTPFDLAWCTYVHSHLEEEEVGNSIKNSKSTDIENILLQYRSFLR